MAGIATTLNSYGVFGECTGFSGYGVYGSNDSSGYGVYGLNTSTGYAVYASGDLGVTGTPKANQSTFSALSDIRLKKNVKPLEGALGSLLQLRGVTYEWKNPSEHGNQTGIQRGFIAQEVEKVLPEWISTDSDGMKRIGIPGRGLEAMLVESIRELKTQNDALRDRVQVLEQGHRSPPLTSRFPAGLGGGVALGFLPVGMIAVLRRRRRAQN